MNDIFTPCPWFLPCCIIKKACGSPNYKIQQSALSIQPAIILGWGDTNVGMVSERITATITMSEQNLQRQLSYARVFGGGDFAEPTIVAVSGSIHRTVVAAVVDAIEDVEIFSTELQLPAFGEGERLG